MYELFYGLKEKPFTLLPDPEYLYLSQKHQRALTLLQYAMLNHAGFCVICGDTGAGKTTLIRRLLDDLGDETCVGLITNTHKSFGELLNWVLMAFGLDADGKTKPQMHHTFVDFLVEQYAQNKHAVLIVDEAQNMDADTLEELRMLSNINADKDQILQVILVGQPALRETLLKPELMQFAQRIAVDYYLETLDLEEARAYIRHRLRVAGSDTEIFTDDACTSIYNYSGGTPRLINLLCDTALVYGYAEQKEVINVQLVHDVVREQHSNSIIPTFNTNPSSRLIKSPTEVSQEDKTKSVCVETPNPYAERQILKHKVDREDTFKQSEEETIEAMNQEQITEDVPEGEPETTGKQQDEIIADLAQRAVQAVTHADKSAKRVFNQPITNLRQTEPHHRGLAVENTNADKEYQGINENSNVTPINAKLSETEIENTETKNTQVNEFIEINFEQNKIEKSSVNDQFDENQNKEKEADVYPMVQVTEREGKGIGMMMMGMVAGMFITSIVMLVIAWFILGQDRKFMFSTVQNAEANDESLQKNKQREVEILQKERDAALAVSRALERERDAALSAAKIHEQIRVAEQKAAQALAEHKVRTEKRIREAQLRAELAEKAAVEAIKRERTLHLKAEEDKLAELEQKRLQLLKEETLRKELIAQQENEMKRFAQLKAAAEEEKALKVKKKKTKAFSANPCNSPSAKFLSTCKK